MIEKPILSDAFTLEDIRKLRNYYDEKFMDKDGNVDWEGLRAETKEKADRVRAEIAQIRAERAVAQA
jgi:hypothetical protein